MKKRPKGFLAENVISHDSEIFDYITELHGYLWQIIRAVKPEARGLINMYLDDVVQQLHNVEPPLERKEGGAKEACHLGCWFEIDGYCLLVECDG